MARFQDMRRESHISWNRAVYAGEHGGFKAACHIGKDGLLYLYTVYLLAGTAWKQTNPRPCLGAFGK